MFRALVQSNSVGGFFVVVVFFFFFTCHSQKKIGTSVRVPSL